VGVYWWVGWWDEGENRGECERGECGWRRVREESRGGGSEREEEEEEEKETRIVTQKSTGNE